jgi:hypothetical protein
MRRLTPIRLAAVAQNKQTSLKAFELPFVYFVWFVVKDLYACFLTNTKDFGTPQTGGIPKSCSTQFCNTLDGELET